MGDVLARITQQEFPLARPAVAPYQNIAFLFMRWFQISDKGGANSITGWASSVINHDATDSAGRHRTSDSDSPFWALSILQF